MSWSFSIASFVFKSCFTFIFGRQKGILIKSCAYATSGRDVVRASHGRYSEIPSLTLPPISPAVKREVPSCPGSVIKPFDLLNVEQITAELVFSLALNFWSSSITTIWSDIPITAMWISSFASSAWELFSVWAKVLSNVLTAESAFSCLQGKCTQVSVTAELSCCRLLIYCLEFNFYFDSICQQMKVLSEPCQPCWCHTGSRGTSQRCATAGLTWIGLD